MDMDSNYVATMRGRCRVCLDSGVDVVALSQTVCVLAEEITFSQMLKTCCAIEISASDLKPQTVCNPCAKTAEQSFTFRKICQNADIRLQEELDGVNIKVEPDELVIKVDQEEALGGDDMKVESDELIVKEKHEEDDHKNGIMATIKDEFPDCASISNTDEDTQLQFKENTSSTEQIVCKICQTYFTDWIILEHHLENCYTRVCGMCGETFTSDATLNEHILTHEAPSMVKKVMSRHEKLKCYKCRLCGMSYKYPAELRNHIMTHTTVKHYLCSYCGNKFSLSHDSKCYRTHSRHSHKHINKKTTNSKVNYSLKTQRRVGCSICRKSYRQQKSVMNHKCIKTSKKPHKYSPSGKTFYSSDLKRHARSHTGENRYECSQCKKRFQNQSNLNRHKRSHTGKKPYECSHCNKRFIYRHHLTSHEHTHTGEKPYECPHCSKCFATQSYLNTHERIHTGEKPYKCSHCSKCFTQQHNLITHERSHTGEKPHECPHCSKRFAKQSNLARHSYTHTGEKPYECPHCSKCFSRKSNLTKHERTHTGEKPYECPDCKKRFTNSSALTVHKRTHTDEKPYECAYCNKRCNQKGALAIHERTHTGEKPYECPDCRKRFTYSGALTVHKRTHTGEQP